MKLRIVECVKVIIRLKCIIKTKCTKKKKHVKTERSTRILYFIIYMSIIRKKYLSTNITTLFTKVIKNGSSFYHSI